MSTLSGGWVGRALAGGRYRVSTQLGDWSWIIELDPKAAAAFFSRGEARREQNELPLALADFNQVIRLAPRLPDGYFGRAETQRVQGNLPAAIADCNRTLVLDPKHVLSYGTRGECYRAQGNLQQALADLNRAPDARTELRLGLQSSQPGPPGAGRPGASGGRPAACRTTPGAAEVRAGLICLLPSPLGGEGLGVRGEEESGEAPRRAGVRGGLR